MKKIIISGFCLAFLLLSQVGCGTTTTEISTTDLQSESVSESSSAQSQDNYSSSQISSGKSKSTPSKSFTNKYGTPTTKCAVSGCDNYIASSGDTNCCATHSNRCGNCNKYIDGDAMYCIDCLIAATK